VAITLDTAPSGCFIRWFPSMLSFYSITERVNQLILVFDEAHNLCHEIRPWETWVLGSNIARRKLQVYAFVFFFTEIRFRSLCQAVNVNRLVTIGLVLFNSSEHWPKSKRFIKIAVSSIGTLFSKMHCASKVNLFQCFKRDLVNYSKRRSRAFVIRKVNADKKRSNKSALKFNCDLAGKA